MSEITKDGRSFIGYEYKEIYADQEKASMYIDGYASFGWIADENIPPAGRLGKAAVRLKRDRKILNKAELTRLQRHFDSCMAEIDALEKSRYDSAAIRSISVGIIGTAFMAGSVFAVTAQPPEIILTIILAIPAFAGWILPYFIFKRTLLKRTQDTAVLIEQKYDEIYEICEKGSKLL